MLIITYYKFTKEIDIFYLNIIKYDIWQLYLKLIFYGKYKRRIQ